jgi:hypothetical protein
MAHLGPRAFDAIGGEVVSTTATVSENQQSDASGAYVRLVDLMSETEKNAALQEATANPDCGWFYRRSASDFAAIPGSPIAYWCGKGFFGAFKNGISVDALSDFTGSQNITADNNRYLRRYW